MKNSNEQLINLKGKVAIITGCSTGLGAAAAKILSNAGANIVINHLEGQEKLARKLADDLPTDSICFSADISNDRACRAMVDAALNEWGHVDILVNNAGINKPVEHNNLEGLTGADFTAIFNVNVVGAYQMIRAVSATMKAQGAGIVVNISSNSAENGLGSSVAYSASKAAINTMTRSLARALAPEIRINAVCPGYMDTPLWEKLNLSDEQRQKICDEVANEAPLKTPPTAEIVARSLLFLATDLSAHLTGQLITSDGGRLLGTYQSIGVDD